MKETSFHVYSPCTYKNHKYTSNQHTQTSSIKKDITQKINCTRPGKEIISQKIEIFKTIR